MEQDLAYRIAAIALIMPPIAISVYFRRRADKIGGKITPSAEERVYFPILRLLMFGHLGFLLCNLVNPAWIPWAFMPLHEGVRIFAGFVVLLGTPALYWMFSTLDRNVTPTASTREDSELVTTGPYRWIRHPLYTFGFTLHIAMAVMLANWVLLCFWPIAMVILNMRTNLEERRLVERFGDDYREYMTRTGRYFPKLNSKKKEAAAT